MTDQQPHSPNPDDVAMTDTPAAFGGSGDADTATSIIDTVLDLNAFMAADIRLPARTTYVQTRPHLFARRDELIEELKRYVDDRGNLVGDEAAAGERDGTVVMADLKVIQDALDAGRAAGKVIVEKMSTAAWDAFGKRFADELDEQRLTLEMRRQLVVDSPTTPAIDETAYDWIREHWGDPAIGAISDAAWDANTATGADQGKSPLYSLVQRQRARGQS